MVRVIVKSPARVGYSLNSMIVDKRSTALVLERCPDKVQVCSLRAILNSADKENPLGARQQPITER